MIATGDAADDIAPDEASCTATLVYRHTGQALPGEVKLAGDFEVSPWSAGITMEGPTSSGEYVARLELSPGRLPVQICRRRHLDFDAENEFQEADVRAMPTASCAINVRSPMSAF